MKQCGLANACFALLLAIGLFVVQERAQTVTAEAAPTHVFVVNKVVLTASGQTREAKKPSEPTPVIVFVCEHGAAKSVVAAAHFNKLAGDRGLNYRAIARGTNPDEEIAPMAAKSLQADGLKPDESAPKKISKDDLVGARRVITFCLLPDSYPGQVKVENWDGIPPFSENYGNARDWLVGQIYRLLEELEAEK